MDDKLKQIFDKLSRGEKLSTEEAYLMQQLSASFANQDGQVKQSSFGAPDYQKYFEKFTSNLPWDLSEKDLSAREDAALQSANQSMIQNYLSKVSNGTATQQDFYDYQQFFQPQNTPTTPTVKNNSQSISESELSAHEDMALRSANESIIKDYLDKMRNGTATQEDFFDYQQRAKEFNDISRKTGVGKIYDPNAYNNQARVGTNTTENKYPYEGAETDPNSFQNANSFLPYLFPGGSDLTSELYTLGRAIGADKGQKGRALTGIAAGGAAALDIARNLASGIAFEKMNQQVDDIYQKKRKQPLNFSPEEQTRNTNNTGGINFELGGMFFGEEGGEMELGNGQHNMQEEGQENVQQQSQEQPQDQQQMMEQLISIVSQMLQQGKDPNQIVQSLVQQGIPQQQAIAIVQMVQQQQAQLKTKNGEMVNAQPGDTISFKHGGKKVTGKVKEIRDGKIILE